MPTGAIQSKLQLNTMQSLSNFKSGLHEIKMDFNVLILH